MKKLSVVMAALFAAFVLMFAAPGASADVTLSAKSCNKEILACEEKAGACEAQKKILEDYVDRFCPPADKADLSKGPKPAPTPTPPPPVKPIGTSDAVKPTPPPPPPAKPWSCKGYSATPETAPTALGCSCTDSRYSLVLGIADHVAYCVVSARLPDVTKAIDWLGELYGPKYTDPANEVERKALVAKISNLLLKIEMVADGLDDAELKGILKRMRDQLADIVKQIDDLKARLKELEDKVRRNQLPVEVLCGIENLDDPKWTPEEIRKQCKSTGGSEIDVEAAIEHARTLRWHVTTRVAMSSSPGPGLQVAMLTGVMLEGKFTSTFRYIAGLDVGGTFVSPKTGAQAFVWPFAGFRFWLSESDLRNAISLDLKFGVKQNISVAYPHNPTIAGTQYQNSQFWGYCGTAGADLNIRANRWLGVTFGGWVGSCALMATVPETADYGKTHKVLPQGRGFAGGASLGVTFSF